MEAAALRSEERIGLGLAIVAHAALVALLLVQRPAAVVMPPDRIEVTISDDVGLTSTSPEPRAQAAPDVAPQIGEPPPPEPEPAPAGAARRAAEARTFATRAAQARTPAAAEAGATQAGAEAAGKTGTS